MQLVPLSHAREKIARARCGVLFTTGANRRRGLATLTPCRSAGCWADFSEDPSRLSVPNAVVVVVVVCVVGRGRSNGGVCVVCGRGGERGELCHVTSCPVLDALQPRPRLRSRTPNIKHFKIRVAHILSCVRLLVVPVGSVGCRFAWLPEWHNGIPKRECANFSCSAFLRSSRSTSCSSYVLDGRRHAREMVFAFNTSIYVLNNVVSPYSQVARAITNFEGNSLVKSHMHHCLFACTQPSSLAIAVEYPNEYLVFVPLPFAICVLVSLENSCGNSTSPKSLRSQ